MAGEYRDSLSQVPAWWHKDWEDRGLQVLMLPADSAKSDPSKQLFDCAKLHLLSSVGHRKNNTLGISEISKKA
jgi:hypothetical protein